MKDIFKNKLNKIKLINLWSEHSIMQSKWKKIGNQILILLKYKIMIFEKKKIKKTKWTCYHDKINNDIHLRSVSWES